MPQTHGRRTAPAFSRLTIIVLLALSITPAAVEAQGDANGVTTLTGKVALTTDDLALYSEPLVVLTDASVLDAGGDVIAGGAPVPSIASQISTGLVPDTNDRYSFSLSLPIVPQGTPTSISGADADARDLPQVFSIDLVSNIAGQPFVTDIDTYGGSPSLLSSIGTDDSGNATGQVAVWSDGAGAQFPGSVGDDGQALTRDDPLEDLDAGWTLVDFSRDTYDFARDSEIRVDFPGSALDESDFSRQGWTEAFTSLVDQLEVKYPFTDLKGIDFDALRKTYTPMVQRAEDDADTDAYTLAIYQFSLEFMDGHVSSSVPYQWLSDNYLAGYGLTVGRADDGTVYVIDVVAGASADDAGIEPGDSIERWDGKKIGDAIADTPLALSASSDFARDNQRVRLLTRAPGGDTVEVGYTNGDGDSKTDRLESARDTDGFLRALTPESAGDDAAMPIESRVLDSGVGYIRINTFETDVVLFTHQWDYAIRTMQQLGVMDLVVDVRANPGGLAALAFYASASFAKDQFVLDTAYIANRDGEFVDSGDEVVPVSEVHWDGATAVLVDDNCASSCEQFAGTMDAIEADAITIVGNTASAGVYAAVRTWTLPDDITFQAPFIRYEVDGEIFLEGQGVQPDVTVPVTGDSLLSPDDEVLEAGDATAQGRDVGSSRTTGPAN